MSDIIDRQQALDDARSWVGMNWYEQHLMRNVVEWLEEFPSAKFEIESQWIPTSERLPEIDRDVLLSYFDEVTIGWLNSDGSWSIYDGWKCVSADEISAWMPLPKVFKENEHESNRR